MAWQLHIGLLQFSKQLDLFRFTLFSLHLNLTSNRPFRAILILLYDEAHTVTETRGENF